MNSYDENMKKFWEKNGTELRLFAGAPPEARKWACVNKDLDGWHIRRAIDGKFLPVKEEPFRDSEVYAFLPSVKTVKGSFVVFKVDHKGDLLDNGNDLIEDGIYNWMEAAQLVSDSNIDVSHFCGFHYPGNIEEWTPELLGRDSEGLLVADMDNWVQPVTPRKVRFYRK